MKLEDERQEEIIMLEKKIIYLQNQLTECAEFERKLILERDEMKRIAVSGQRGGADRKNSQKVVLLQCIDDRAS